MALVLRSNSDLLYYPDHGFVGEEGALRILLQVTRQIRRLDISHNLLGRPGARTLLNGLSTLRSRYSSPELGLWGLKEMNLGCNALDDAALDAAMAYVKKDVCMRKLLVQANEIELRDNLNSVLNSLNSSRLVTLSLTNNPRLFPSSLTHLFATLSSPHLTELHLNTCALGPSLAFDIAAFLRSPRSRNLELLELNGNYLGLAGVRAIIDAVEYGNYTIKHLGLVSNDSRPPVAEGEDPPADNRSQEEKRAEECSLSYEVHQRLPVLLERNRGLTRRAWRAAARCLAPARILLNARPPDDIDIARQVIDDVSSNRTHKRAFPVLELPQEVLYLVVRHMSGDAQAMSDNQFARLRAEAQSAEALRKAVKLTEIRLRGVYGREVETVMRELRDEWLRRGKWDRWELDRPGDTAKEEASEDRE